MNLRENIKKELRITEQLANPNNRCMQLQACWGSNTRSRYGTVNNGIPQVGQMIDVTWMGRTWYVSNVSNPGSAAACSSQAGITGAGDYNLYQGTTCCPRICGTAVNNIWHPQFIPSGFTVGMNNVGCSGNGNMCCGNANYAANTGSNCTSSCDTTPASACAQQWFGPNASNFANFMSSNDCTTYTWPATNLETQANTIMAAAPNLPTIPYTYNNWDDIKNAANASGLGQPQKGQFKRKMAKAMYSQCQIQACNC